MFKPGRKGFSMLELVFTTSLLGLMVGLFMVNGGTRLKAKPGADALAEALANELAQARLLAMRQLSPVAVMFPCDGGRPHSASLYQLEGLTNPHVSRSHNFAGDFPNYALFMGIWEGSESTTPLVTGTKWANFDVNQWLPAARKKDSALVFMPDGTVRGVRAGGGLPHFNGEYHVAVSAGVAYSGATLNAAGETDTVCINGGGAIRVESGLTGSSLHTIGTLPSSGAPSVPVLQTQVGRAKGDSKGDSSLPAPVDGNPTTIPPDGYATVTAYAEDVNQSGERLFLRWDVAPPSGRGTGVFSIPLDNNRGAAMDFNPEATVLDGSSSAIKPAYQSSYQWHPPADAQPGDVFRLQLMLQDQASGTWKKVGIQHQVQIDPYGAVLFAYQKGAQRSLFRMNANGSGKSPFRIFPSTVADPKNYREFSPAASYNGNRIVFLSDNRDGVPSGCQDIFMTDRDGITCTQVTKGLYCEAPCLSPDGSHVAFKVWNGSNYTLHVAPVAPPTTPSNLGAPLQAGDGVAAIEGANSPGLSDYNRNVFREERLCWVSRMPNDRLLYTKLIHGHTAVPPVADGPPVTGDHPFIFEFEIARDGHVVSGPTNSFGESLHFGTWSANVSAFTGLIYRTVDGAAVQGDPLIKLNPPGWSLNTMGSPGFHDTQPTSYLAGNGAGSEALLVVRSPTTDYTNFKRICRLPRGSTNDADVTSISQDLTAGNCTCPVYLR